MMPPITAIVSLFRNFQPIMESMTKLKGNQTFSKPEIVEKIVEGKKYFIVVERTIFDNHDDLKFYLDIFDRCHSMKV